MFPVFGPSHVWWWCKSIFHPQGSKSFIQNPKGGSPFNECESRDWRNSLANGFFQSPFEANKMLCLLNKFVLFTNQKQPLKCVRQNSYLHLWSYALYIMWQWVHLLANLQAGGTNKLTTKAKSLIGIPQGFDKCIKATLQNNYFWRTPPEDYFCLWNMITISLL